MFIKKHIKKHIIRQEDIDIIKQYQIINNFNQNKIYYLHNSYHLGDNIFNFILFYMIKDFIEINNIKIFYYAKKEYLYQIKEFLYSPNIFLFPLNAKPNNSIELWTNNNLFKNNHCKQHKPINFNNFYKIFFNEVLTKFNFNLNINKFFYKDDDLIARYNNIPDKYKKFDILILNSQPNSDQYDYNKNEWNNYIIKLNNKYKILTTTKVKDLICTIDNNLTVKDIASLSTKAKVIIAINSGVVPGLLNIFTLKNVKHFYIFDKNNYFSYPNFENKNLITDISYDELDKYINLP